MKALPKKLLPLTLFGIAVTLLLYVRPAQAYTVTLEQIGSNVVATGSGAFDLTGLTFLTSGQVSGFPGVAPSDGIIHTGPTGLVNFDAYIGFTGPSSFGSGGLAVLTNIGSGDPVGIDALVQLYLPLGYVSGSALSSSATFNNATLASLGVTPGTYVWTWGTGVDQRFTLQIGSVGVPGVPDGGSTVSLLGFALFGLAALRRKLSC
jgi:VPDSG-CTERM motif